MSGFDKAILKLKLLETGLWVETDNEQLFPSDVLWKNKPDTFTEYDARDLHNLLSVEKNQIEE